MLGERNVREEAIKHDKVGYGPYTGGPQWKVQNHGLALRRFVLVAAQEVNIVLIGQWEATIGE